MPERISSGLSSVFLPAVFLLLLTPALYAGSTCRAGRWVAANSAEPFPSTALQAGEEDGKPLYLCRAPYSAGMHPGKIDSGNCHITYGVKEVEVSDYQVLVDAKGSWKNANKGYDSALSAGWEHGHNLFLCRAQHNGAMLPGKVVNGTCHINYGEGEISVKRFELFYPSGAGRIDAGIHTSGSKTMGILGMLTPVPVGGAGVGGGTSSGSSSTKTQSSSTTTTSSSASQSPGSMSTSSTTQTSTSTRSTTTGGSTGVHAGVGVAAVPNPFALGSLGGHKGGWMYPDCSEESTAASPTQ